MPDLSSESFDPAARYSTLDGLDNLSGLLALVLTVLVAFDIYSWFALHRQPRLSVFWILPTLVSLWRRAILGQEAARRWPKAWYLGLGAYFTVVLGVLLIRRPIGGEQWAMAGVAVLFIVLSFRHWIRR